MTPVPVVEVRSRVAAGASLPAAVGALGGLHGGALGARGLVALDAGLRAQLYGAGEVLQPLLQDPDVTDVMVNGTRVWVDRGAGMEPVAAELGGAVQVRALATRLAAACGQRLDDACPVVDGTLPDGSRLHAVLPPVSASGTLLSLRTQRPRGFTLAQLVAAGTVPAALEPVLRALVTERANVVISGATGSGKTTLLACLLALVAASERIVCIEEAAELRPDHQHVVHLQVRRPNVQGAGEVPLSVLVRAAMRMRPDRLVLGECRGAEVREVLGALNTGHDGGWATVHANTSGDVPARLVALGALAGMGEQTVAAQAVSALDAVLHLRRVDGRRRLVEIGVLARRDGELCCDLAVRVDAAGRLHEGPAWHRLAGRLGSAVTGPVRGAAGRHRASAGPLEQGSPSPVTSATPEGDVVPGLASGAVPR